LQLQEPIMTDEHIQAKVLALAAEHSSAPEIVSVTVRDGRVTLSGMVGAWFERDEIERQVWQTAGVRAVDNRLTYPEGSGTAEVEEVP
jgi:osmotically-inducible protein OsmY